MTFRLPDLEYSVLVSTTKKGQWEPYRGRDPKRALRAYDKAAEFLAQQEPGTGNVILWELRPDVGNPMKSFTR